MSKLIEIEDLPARTGHMIDLILEMSDEVEELKHGWVEIHFDGSRTQASLKKKTGVRKASRNVRDRT